jgi:hypothetical protein
MLTPDGDGSLHPSSPTPGTIPPAVAAVGPAFLVVTERAVVVAEPLEADESHLAKANDEGCDAADLILACDRIFGVVMRPTAGCRPPNDCGVDGEVLNASTTKTDDKWLNDKIVTREKIMRHAKLDGLDGPSLRRAASRNGRMQRKRRWGVECT